MKIPMKAITITYTKTVTISPTSQMFEDWDVEPSQEAFESLMLGEFFDDILEDVGGNGTPMDHTDVKQFEDVVVNWDEDDDEDEEERYDRDFNAEGMGDMIGPPDRTAMRKEVDDYFEIIKND